MAEALDGVGSLHEAGERTVRDPEMARRLSPAELVALDWFTSRFDVCEDTSREDSDGYDETNLTLLMSSVTSTTNSIPAVYKLEEEAKWWVKPRSTEWIEVLVISPSLFEDDRFYANFRMRRDSFERLLGRLERRISRSDTNFRKAIPADRVLLAFLYYAAHGSTFEVLHEKFGIGISTCSKILRRVATAICALGLISLPSAVELGEIAERNEQRTGIPQCTLSVDGSHIPILQPSVIST